MDNAADILEREQARLMARWQDRHLSLGKHRFVADGAVCPDEYLASSPKICFLLKEAHFDEPDSIARRLAAGHMSQMWAAVAEWAYGIRHATAGGPLPKRPSLSPEEKTRILRSVAVVNVKKSEGMSESDYGDLLDYVEADRDLLREQIEMLDPDVIVCCNYSSFLRAVYGAGITERRKVDDAGLIDHERMLENGYIVFQGRIVLDYYHPANHYPPLVNYYAVTALYQQALAEKGER